MKIISEHTHNPNIEIVILQGEMTGYSAIYLQEYFYECLDGGKNYFVIDLKYLKKIDGLGINVLCNAKSRGIHVGLLNVSHEIKCMLAISGNENLFKIYNETHSDKVVSMFEKDIKPGKVKTKNSSKMRRYSRIDTCFQAEFSYNPTHKDIISCRANILNLSEGGILADNIMAFSAETKKLVYSPEIDGCGLDEIKFKINEASNFIKSKGKCVGVFKTNEKLSAGIRFKGIRPDYKKKIRDYVNHAIWSK